MRDVSLSLVRRWRWGQIVDEAWLNTLKSLNLKRTMGVDDCVRWSYGGKGGRSQKDEMLRSIHNSENWDPEIKKNAVNMMLLTISNKKLMVSLLKVRRTKNVRPRWWNGYSCEEFNGWHERNSNNTGGSSYNQLVSGSMQLVVHISWWWLILLSPWILRFTVWWVNMKLLAELEAKIYQEQIDFTDLNQQANSI